MEIIQKALKLPHLIILIFKLKLYGVSFGKRIRGNRVVIRNVGKIKLGKNVRLVSYPDGELVRTGLQTHNKDTVITIGDYCNLNGVMIHCNNKIEIGNYCMFGPGSKIVDNDSHKLSLDAHERRDEPPNSAPIIIHDNVWVGMNALVLKGVEIGENAIVAAHAVVTKDAPENSIVAGIPAKVIKTLTK